MTPLNDDFDDMLRRALRAEADSFEPAGDGLILILRRLAAPWLVRRTSLLVTSCVDLARLITIRLESPFRWAMSALAAVGRPPAQGAGARLHRSMAWLRPALAVASVVIIVVTGAFALGQIRQTIASISLSTGTGASAHAPAGAGITGGGHAQSFAGNLSRGAPKETGTTPPAIAPVRAGRTTGRPSAAAASCPPVPAGTLTPTPSPAVTPSGSAAPTPSESPAPTPSETLEPTPSQSQEPTPSQTPEPAPSQSLAPTPAGTTGSAGPGTTNSTAPGTARTPRASGGKAATAAGVPTASCSPSG